MAALVESRRSLRSLMTVPLRLLWPVDGRCVLNWPETVALIFISFLLENVVLNYTDVEDFIFYVLPSFSDPLGPDESRKIDCRVFVL